MHGGQAFHQLIRFYNLPDTDTAPAVHSCVLSHDSDVLPLTGNGTLPSDAGVLFLHRSCAGIRLSSA